MALACNLLNRALESMGHGKWAEKQNVYALSQSVSNCELFKLRVQRFYLYMFSMSTICHVTNKLRLKYIQNTSGLDFFFSP